MFNQIKKLNFLITKRQRKVLVFLVLLLFVGMLFEVLGLGILVPAISLLLDSDFIQKYPEAAHVMAFLGGLSQREFTFLFLGFVVFIYIVKTLFLVVLTYKQNRFLANLTAFISKQLFKKYLSLPYSFHLNRNAATLIKNIQVETNYLNVFCTGLISLFVESSLLLAVVATIVVIEPIGAVSMGAFFGIVSMLFFQFTKRKLILWGNKRQQLDKAIAKTSLQGLSGIKDLKVLGRTSYFLHDFNSASNFRATLSSNRVTLSHLPRFYMELVTVLGLVAFIGLMLLMKKDTAEILTTLGIFVAATFRMIPSINKIIAALQNLKFYNASLDVVYEEMKIPSPPTSTAVNDSFSFSKRLDIKNVSFRYGTELPDVLKDILFDIKKGETIGFKGSSGSGKSTLVDTLIGLHMPTRGSIKVDGIDIHENLHGWQQKIGYVAQDIFLTDDSLLQNVAFGIPESEIDKAAATNAIKAAQLDTFVKTLKKGLQTVVGERGVQLSGGQRQRVGIARALYHQPEILVLDEATASLDMKTEKEVMKAIHALKGQKTILIIAHRLSTLKGCDVVYEMNNGQLKTAKI